MVYATSSGGIENEIRTMEILAIKDDRLYTITFGAQSQEFSDYIPVVEKRLDSLVLQTHNQQPSTIISPASQNPSAPPAELLVLFDLAHKNIDRGEVQTMTVSVVDRISSSVVHDAMVRGELFIYGPRGENYWSRCKVVYSWSVDNNVETGEFTGVIRVSADGYEPISVSETYKVRPKNSAPI